MLTEYAADIPASCAYPPNKLDNVLGQYLADQNKTQLRIAETEKYAHVTFFFNGGREEPFTNEDRTLIPSPNVKTYDLQPEMSAFELTDALVAAIHSHKYDAIICNYANGDMVGHTGDFDAAVKAVEAVDKCLENIVAAAEESGAELLITADHGNVEQMLDLTTNQPLTSHTAGPVPLVYVGKSGFQFTQDGSLCDTRTNPTHTARCRGAHRDDRPGTRCEGRLRVPVSFLIWRRLKIYLNKRSLGFTVALLFSTLSPNQALSQAASSDRQALQELESVAAAIEDIRGWLNTANQTIGAEQSALRQADNDFARLSNRTDQTHTSIQLAQTELDALTFEALALNVLKTGQATTLNQLIRAAYIRGAPNLLKDLFSQDDQDGITNAAQMLHYTLKYSEAQLQKINEFEALIEQIKKTEIATAAKVVELQEQDTALRNQLAALDSARLKKQNALMSLRTSIASKDQELEQLEINQADLQRLIEEIRIVMEGVRSFADVPPFASAKGRLTQPLNGRFSSRFGERYGDGNLSRQGITIQAETGTPVRAVHAGLVVFADWLRGSGLLVIIDHGQGFLSLYGGNEALSAIAGNWVDAGDILSTSGTSISSGVDGLYFEIRRNGQPQDPNPWFNSDR